MNARNRVFLMLGLLTLGSLIWYLVTVRPSSDLQMIGTVDANEVIVGARITARVEKLLVDEGQQVKAGDLIAVLESNDLEAAHKAALATAESDTHKVSESLATEKQTRGEVVNARKNSASTLAAAEATLQQAEANYAKQKAETTRTVALADQGIMSAQAKEEAVAALAADSAAIETSKRNVEAARAALHQAEAHEMAADVAARTVATNQALVKNAQSLADQADAQLGYTKIYAPVSGRINVRAVRQGEVVTAGSAIVTITDLTETWIYAPLPETQADAVQLGDMLRVVMPSGATFQGKVINKATESDFATQRDVSARKRDIKTVQLKLLIPNENKRWVPGMTAEVYLPKSKLVTK